MSLLKKIFGIQQKTPDEQQNIVEKHMRVVVTAFADTMKSNSGKLLSDILQKKSPFDVAYYANSLPKDSMIINSKNLLEIFDFCIKIFHKISADVIILGYQSQEKMCLYFATYGEYESLGEKSWRIFEPLYLPASAFEQESTLTDDIINLITGAVLLCKNNISGKDKLFQKNQLKELISFLKTSTPNVPDFCIPYITNLLAAMYFEYHKDNMDKQAFESIKYMLEQALKNKDTFFEKIHIAPLYIHVGNLFYCAAKHLNTNSITYFNKATQAYSLAQEYFAKNEYPYDYAQLAYNKAQIYFGQWLYTKNLEYLHKAISDLREVEKIYTTKMFPATWAKLQHEIGYYLSLLGNCSGSVEILQMAIQSMSNAQKIFYAGKYPFIWLDIQADIGRINYFIGKKYKDLEYLKKSEKCFREALIICDLKNADNEKRKIESDISKTVELIYTLQQK